MPLNKGINNMVFGMKRILASELAITVESTGRPTAINSTIVNCPVRPQIPTVAPIVIFKEN